MNEENDKITNIDIYNEMKTSFIDYSMSVIVARALPDVRDGLKPIHRRIIYGMNSLGITPSSQFKKSARIVGEVMGKYHPHGDSSIYDAMVRMAQDFNYRYTLVEGHGNFGSIDGDGAAASRYTEARMSKISTEMVKDLNKDTVNFIPNFDGEETEPEVLPSRFPNILVNGTSGIAVGMATNIPPHNLGEVIDGCVAYINDHEITTEGLMEYIKAPDFPTGALILGNSGIRKAYETGKGIIQLRANANIEESTNGKHTIVVTELPYQVNKAVLIKKIAELVRDKVIDGITNLVDETNLKTGIRIVIEIRRDANANVILNNLFKHTALQSSFGINMLALVDGQPKTLGLKEIIEHYINFQKEIIIRRSKFDLDKAEKRKHILDGYIKALDNIDEVIKIIKEAKKDLEAKEKLIQKFDFTELQTEAILEMKLRRLTGLEREKIDEEAKEILQLINKLNEILSSDKKVEEIIIQELNEIKEKYGDERRTKIDLTSIENIEDESLIPEEEIVITITNKNYIKRITSDTYKTQHRGGIGIKGITTNEEDFVKQLISLTTHDYILFFSNKGKVYRLKGYEIPEFSRTAKGLPIVNLLQIEKDEKINTILTVEKENDCKYLIFATKNGVVKKTSLDDFDRIRQSGKIAITLKENDELISVKKVKENDQILLCSTNGRMARFSESEVRTMGRNATGVRGINLTDDICIGVEVSDTNRKILVITENGYGKKTDVTEYRETKRGSKGVKALQVTEKNGKIKGFKSVSDDMDLMIITDNGMIIRISMESVSSMGRVTQGVKLINLKSNTKVSSISVVEKEEEMENDI